MTAAKRKEAGKRPYRPGCRHCLVWSEGDGEILIRCFHCSSVVHKIATQDSPEYIARKCAETRDAHSVLCWRIRR